MVEKSRWTFLVGGWNICSSNWILSPTHWWDFFLVIFVDRLVVCYQPIWNICASQIWDSSSKKHSGWKFSQNIWVATCHPLDLVQLVRKPLMNMFILHKIPTGLSFDQRLRKSCEITCDVIWKKKCKCKHSQSPWQLYIYMQLSD